MATVIEILEQLEATSGSNAKIDILETYSRNSLLKSIFVAAQDPYIVYYVNKFKMPAPAHPASGGSDLLLERFLQQVLPRLSTRAVTGNDAKALVEREFSTMNVLEQKWCQRILIKNMRCGVQASTVNKVWPDAIKGFEVALAKTLKSDFVKGEGIKILEEVQYPVRVEPKLDGLRCIAVKQSGVVTFYTRNGTVLETLPKIKASLEAAHYDNVVLDGEAMGEDWNESASVLMAKKSKHDDSNIVYNVFDAMPLNDWINQDSTMPYAERVKLVLTVVDNCREPNAPVKQVPHIMARNESELKAYFAKCMDEGFEGVMLKTLNTPYKFKRSDNILKLKPCVTYEGVIVGHYQGRRGTKREGLFGGFRVVLPNGIVTRVGGGFSDELKALIQLEGPDTWIGKIIEIEAQPDPLTTDGLTRDGKARFPVYVRTRSENDVDPSVIIAGQKYQQEDHGIATAQ